MNLACCRHRIKAVAFCTIIGWIALVTILITLMIWEAVHTEHVLRVIWSATTLTIGILLICVTIHGFAAAEDDSERRRRAAEVPQEVSEATGLREAMLRAKEETERT